MIRRLVLVIALAACGPGAKGGPSMNNHLNQPEATPQSSDVISADIMAREPIVNQAVVKHILIGWKDLNDTYQGHIDARAAKRTKKDAEDTVRSIMTQLKAGADFDKLMKSMSEDQGSAATGRTYTVSPDAQLVIEFRQMGLRLKVGEIGVVESDYGFHIVKRLE